MCLKYSKDATRAGVEKGGTIEDEVKGDSVAQTVAWGGSCEPGTLKENIIV